MHPINLTIFGYKLLIWLHSSDFLTDHLARANSYFLKSSFSNAQLTRMTSSWRVIHQKGLKSNPLLRHYRSVPTVLHSNDHHVGREYSYCNQISCAVHWRNHPNLNTFLKSIQIGIEKVFNLGQKYSFWDDIIFPSIFEYFFIICFVIGQVVWYATF